MLCFSLSESGAVFGKKLGLALSLGAVAAGGRARRQGGADARGRADSRVISRHLEPNSLNAAEFVCFSGAEVFFRL
jgi:hypothetical protein